VSDSLEEVIVSGARRTTGSARSGVNILTTADPYFDLLGGNFNFEAAQLSALRNTQLATVEVAPVIEQVDVAAPRITSMAQGNAMMAERGLGSRFLIDSSSELGQLLDYAESPAGRAEDARALARRIAEANAIDVVPEVVVSGARAAIPEVLVSAGRILGGVPFGIASALVEGGLALGSYLSDLALDNALRRLIGPQSSTPPPERPPPVATDPAEFGPEMQPEVTVPGRRPPAPAPFRDPFLPLDVPYTDPFFLTTPAPSSPTSSPTSTPTPLLTEPFTFSTPLTPDFSLDVPELFTLAPPITIPQDISTPWNSPAPTGPPVFNTPTSTRNCDCPQPRKKKRKKKARDVCYRGEYVERRNGLTKFRERKIPCR
jgi:hypothetical protein